MSTLALRNGVLADGTAADVHVTGDVVDRVTEPGGLGAAAAIDIDLAGMLLLPALAEPHAHLDKAFLAETVPNATGDLMGAILAMEAHRHLLTVDDTIARAERAVRLMSRNGVTAVRTHVDVTDGNRLDAVDALTEVRARVADVVRVEIVALTGWPSIGAAGAEHVALLHEAIARGVDAVGGCPHLEDDQVRSTDQFLAIAADAGLPVDLHTDETLDPSALGLEHLARRVGEGFPHPVTASHCVSLGVQPERRQHEIAALVATAGIAVVALPHTNLFLQGRGHPAPMPRGLTAVDALRAAGVNVVAGADNLQDPFNPLGRGDPLETAALMVMAAHLLPHDALVAVSDGVRSMMRLPDAGPRPGARADMVAIPAHTVRGAVADQPSGRLVIAGGRLVHDGR